MKNNFKKIRLAIVAALVSLGWLVLAGRLFEIQVVHGSEYGQQAHSQSTGKISVPADRGLLYDRTGREVAINVSCHALYAYPRNKNEVARIHRYLDRLYGWKAGTSRKKFRLHPGRFAWIDRNIAGKRAARVGSDDPSGLFLRQSSRRDYPFGRIGRGILGCTDVDNRGIAGLEFSQDSLLAGRPGLTDYLRDGKRNTYRLRDNPLVAPVPGGSLVLTIDWYLQEIVEEELKEAVKRYGAESGTAVFLSCRTGEILAAADYTIREREGTVKLHAVSDCFEPGSVLKVVTAAALLDAGLIDLDEKIYCENGLWQCGRRRLRDDKKYDSLTFNRIIELSSNIGVGKLAQRLGGEALAESLGRFGFGRKFFIELPGEVSGSIGDPGVWSEYNIAALAMGHSISATPLQLAAAMAAVANGGRLYRPQIIGGIISSGGAIEERLEPELLGRVASEESAAILRDCLHGVVDSGTATPAKSDIISLGGKTGTAQIPDPERGGYRRNEYNASFAGYFPAEKPQVAGIVVLNRPRPVHYGGHTSGPTFTRIAERYAMANGDNLRPRTRLMADTDDSRMITVPDFVGQEIGTARTVAGQLGLETSGGPDEGRVVWQYPPAYRRMPGPSRVVLLVENPDGPLMADLKGVPLRSAVAALTFLGLEFSIDGRGAVVRQFPQPGARVSEKTTCRLVCRQG